MLPRLTMRLLWLITTCSYRATVNAVDKVENATEILRRGNFAILLSETQAIEDDTHKLLNEMEDRILKNLPNVFVDAANLDQDTPTPVIIPEDTQEKYDVTEIEINQASHVAGYLFSGDIRLTKEQQDGLISNFNHLHYKYNYDYEVNGNVRFWPGGIVPYTFSVFFNKKGRAAVYAAMNEFREKTCINFVPRKNETNYVKFFHGRGCWSWLGFRASGVQKISLQRGSCLSKGIAIHEMMHTLGCGHEHVRTDRDDYIEIVWDNIRAGFLENFRIQKGYKLSKKYDYLSITHYPERAFAIHPNKNTIKAKGEEGALIGQRRELSDLDALSLNNVYCDDTNSIKGTKT